MLPLMRLVTMDIIGLTAFGSDFGCVANAGKGQPETMLAFEFLLDEHTRRLASINPLDTYYFLPTAANRKHKACAKLVRNHIQCIIQRRREEQRIQKGDGVELQSSEPTDFLAHMLTARDQEGAGFSDQDLVDELITLMFAGVYRGRTPGGVGRQKEGVGGGGRKI